MTLGTIIAIVLGIAVLVLLVWGFSQGWNNLWEKVTLFGGGSENVGSIVQACALGCSSGNEYDFCTKIRTVNFEDKTWEKGSCRVLELNSAKIGIGSCDKITCDSVALKDIERSE